MKKQNKQKGITLIALIITIIVMLILVGVSVTLALNGGLFSSAEEARTRTLNVVKEERIRDSGIIKIGDNWYKTYDDYVNSKPIVTTAPFYDSTNGKFYDTFDDFLAGIESENPPPYYDAESYKTYAESLGYTVLTMDEYNSSYIENTIVYSEILQMWMPQMVFHPGDFSYTKIALPYDITGEDSNNKFRQNSTITDVLIPNTMNLIDSYMFSKCSNLESINIPGSVKTINEYAFSGCSKLQSITLQEGIITIKDKAFSGCESLQSITIPESVTTLGGFDECTSLESVTIPESVTTLGGFYSSGLTNVHIPGSVKTIEGAAFTYCENLSTVTFASTFSGCTFGYNVFFGTPWFDENAEYNEEAFKYEVTINGELYSWAACFVEGTKILTPSGLVNIEDVKVGDKVISKNNETGVIEEKEVLKVAKHEIEYNTLKIYVADTEIEVTKNHRMYLKGVGYTEAGKLKVGDILVNVNNVELPIKKIKEVKNSGIKRVYNFIVEDNHNYFVGIDSILVHNKCFVAGSKVLTVNGLVNIEEIKVGDYVIAYNKETGMNEVRKVTETFVHKDVQDQVTVAFKDGSKVEMNMYHPLYTEEGWKSLSSFNGYETLKVGDRVKSEEEYKEITEIKVDLSSKPVNMYTINVEGLDNFYVNGTLAHDNEY